MRKILLSICLLMNLGLSSAQLVQISGYIYERADSTTTLPFASIVNQRTKNGYQSTLDGFYTILAAPGDTIQVTMIGFKTVNFALPAGHTDANYHRNVYLRDKAVVGKEKVIWGITWTRFVNEFEAMEIPEEKKWITLDQDAVTSRVPVKANTGVTLNGPLTWLYNKIGRKAKEQEKLEELQEGKNSDMEYTRRITDEYVMSVTNLPQSYVSDFLLYCYSDNEYYKNATTYDIEAKFLTCLPGFKEKYDITDPPVNEVVPSDSVKVNPN